MRVPFDPPYTQEDLEQLDALHESVGLGEEWLKSEQRCIIANRKRKEAQDGKNGDLGDDT